MAQYQSIFDLMAGVRSGQMFRGMDTDKGEVIDEIDYVDGELREFKAMGLMERNIMAGLNMPDQFTMAGWESEIAINCTAIANSTRPSIGKVNLANTKEVVLQPFTNVSAWSLVPQEGEVYYSRHVGITPDKDKGIIGMIKSMCINMNDAEVGSLPMALIGEKVTQNGDMRHMFTKMYLMMMDCNLSVVTRLRDRFVRPVMRRVYYPNQTSAARLGLIAQKKLVVDVEGFSPEELNFLALSSQAYPQVKYCKDNIYNTCNMREDDLAIVSIGNIVIEDKVMMTPSEMYRLMLSIACKLRCVDDLFSVLQMMRGRCAHIRDVRMIDPETEVYCSLPRSSNFTRAFGGATVHSVIPRTFPTYLCSSVGLIADMILGKGFELVATFLIESFGGYGDLMCEGRADTNQMYNGLLRDYGLSSMQRDVNQLMLEWESVGSCTYDWAIRGSWKPYFIGLTQRFKDGVDVSIPQLCYDLPMMLVKDSVWGAIKNWKGYNGSGISELTDIGEDSKRKRDERLRLTAAFTWSMGMRQVRPKMFANAYAKKEVSLSSSELNWLAGSVGSYNLTHVSYTLADEYLGREDWTEKTATQLIRTAIDGTKCSIIISNDDQRWHISEYRAGAEEIGIRETLAIQERQNVDLADEEILKVLHGKRDADKRPDKRLSEMVDKMRSIVSVDRVILKPGNLNDVGEVASYSTLEGVSGSTNVIHAIVNSMNNRGLVNDYDKARVLSNFEGELAGEKMTDISKVAQALLEYGISLRVYDEKKEGIEVIEYGNASRGVEIVRRDGNYTSILSDSGGGSRKVVKKLKGDLPTHQDLGTLNEMRKWFSI